jgi:retron-type reverse transcriptase
MGSHTYSWKGFALSEELRTKVTTGNTRSYARNTNPKKKDGSTASSKIPTIMDRAWQIPRNMR